MDHTGTRDVNGVLVTRCSTGVISPFSCIDTLFDKNPEDRIVVCREKHYQPEHISLALIKGGDSTPTYRMTKLEALALSHELRKLAIGV